MSLEEVDSLAARLKLRWLGRDYRYDRSPTLRLDDARDTTVKWTLIYGLTFDAGRLVQVEMHGGASGEQLGAFARHLGPTLAAALQGALPAGRDGGSELYCRPLGDGRTASVRVRIDGAGALTVVVSLGDLRPGCMRC